MSIENFDFYDLFLNESVVYDIIKFNHRDIFNEWITQNFNRLDTIYKIESVSPNQKMIKEFSNKGYEHIESQCHYTAKAICLINPKYEFWTGFIKRNTIDYPLATHSFNVLNNKIIDFTVLNDQLELRAEYESLPHIYFGIKIPYDFVLQYKEETLQRYSMNPLLVDWFYKETGLIL